MAQIVSSSEFRKNMATYLDKADNNESVLVVRKSNVIYSISRIDALEPDADLERGISGDEFEERTIQLLKNKIDR